MKTTTGCPKCGNALQAGYLAEFTPQGVRPTYWHPGTPRATFWTATDYAQEAAIPIQAYRCVACGYLEFHAEYGEADVERNLETQQRLDEFFEIGPGG